MAKKFGKILLISAAVSSVAATAVYYYLHKKEHDRHSEEDDYDDFSEEPGSESESSRNYVPLNTENPANPQAAEDGGDGSATETVEDGNDCGGESAGEEPAKEEPAKAESAKEESAGQDAEATDQFIPFPQQSADRPVETVEKFFDEDDVPDGHN